MKKDKRIIDKFKAREHFGTILYNVIIRHGFNSLDEAADFLCLRRDTLVRLIQGKFCPSFDMIVDICFRLNIFNLQETCPFLIQDDKIPDVPFSIE